MSTPSAEKEIATLGGGCFWCLEAVYLEARGVTKVESGYMGGHQPDPTYEQVCAGEQTQPPAPPAPTPTDPPAIPPAADDRL